jgi:putative ABC transport system permease protein
MWLIAARDLQYRRRRFLIAIAATGLVFGIALLLDGASTNINDETDSIVKLFHADGFVVARRATGPFTTTVVIPDNAVSPQGGGRADPFLVSRATVRAGKLVDVNLVGYRPGGLGTPPIDVGRAVRRPGEVVVDSSLDVGVGDTLRVGQLDLRVVGTSSGIRFNFGTPSLFVALRDAQKVVFDGQPLAMAYAARGPTSGVAANDLKLVTNQQAVDDLHRTTKSGSDTVSFINILLWIVAAGIVASIVYLNALERTRDFAVLKATGSSNASIVGGLAFQATLLTLLAAVLAIGVAFVLKPGFPFPVTLSAGSVLKIVVVAIVVGLVASLVGVRRAVTTDPAIAIGGA